MRRSPLRVRLTLWYVLLLGLIMVAFSAALYFSLARSLNQQVDDNLTLAATQVGSEVGQEGSPYTLAGVGSDGALGSLQGRGLTIILLDGNGKRVDASGPYANLALPAEFIVNARAGKATFTSLQKPGNLRFYTAPYLVAGRQTGAIVVGLSRAQVDDALGQMLFILAIAIPITLVVATLFGLFLASRALRPIDRVTRAAAAISSVNLSQRLDLDLPDDEVGRLARTFDAMLTRLDDAFRRQQQFTADASHELRTPLTIIRGEIDVALMQPRAVAAYQLTLAQVGDEIERLTHLVEDLLLLARHDRQQLVQREPLDLAELLPAVVEQMQPLAEAKGQTIRLELAPTLPTLGDSDKLIRLLFNLLDNAIKYTASSGHIIVQGKVVDGEVRVAIADNGSGIAAAHLPHLFERFYRADAARSRSAGGSGLGLAIADYIARAHNGCITVTSEPGSGSCFTLALPAHG